MNARSRASPVNGGETAALLWCSRGASKGRRRARQVLIDEDKALGYRTRALPHRGAARRAAPRD
jgi:hypothetical protein